MGIVRSTHRFLPSNETDGAVAQDVAMQNAITPKMPSAIHSGRKLIRLIICISFPRKIAAAMGRTGMTTKPKPKFIRYAGLVKNFRCSLCATDRTGVRCFAEALPDLCFAPAFAPDVRTEEMKDAESRQSVKSAIAALNKVTSSVCKRLPPHAMPIA